MNARQKAKKLKKKLDYINSHLFTTKKFCRVVDIPAEHLRVQRIVPLAEIERWGEDTIENEVRLQLSRDLMEFISEKIVVNTDRDIDRPRAMKYSADIWVGFGRR